MSVKELVDFITSTKAIAGFAIGAIVVAFGAGFAFKQQYEDAMKSYGALQALQQNKWGPNPGDGPPAANTGTVTCPDGSYVIGITVRNLGSQFGSSITPHCRQLKLQ